MKNTNTYQILTLIIIAFFQPLVKQIYTCHYELLLNIIELKKIDKTKNKSIQEKSNDNGNNIDFDTIGKITGMIIAIPDEKEIIEILQSPSILDSRISEALTLLNKDK